MSVIISEYAKYCPKCGGKMAYVQERCGCKYWLCQECGFKLTEKTCRIHLAEMLK
jgi:ribosomal protein L37AE/L43A